MGEVELRSVSDALAALDHAVAQARAAEIGQLLAILAVCDAYRLDEDQVMAGAERLLQFGGDGTPLVGEFVLAELAPILGVSIESARNRVAQALDLRYRHPHLWDAVVNGSVRVWQATTLTSKVSQAGLDAEAAGWVDRRIAIALALQPFGRVLRQVEGWIVQAALALAAERAHNEANHRHVRIGAISDGHVEVWGRLDAADGLAFDAALDAVADRLAYTGIDAPRQVRRAVAVGELARAALGEPTLLGNSLAPAAGNTVGTAAPVEGVIPARHRQARLAPGDGVARIDDGSPGVGSHAKRPPARAAASRGGRR